LKDWSATESVPSHDPPAAGLRHDASSRRNPRAMAGCRNSPLGKTVMSQEATAMMRKRAMRSGSGCDAAPQHTGTRSAPAGEGMRWTACHRPAGAGPATPRQVCGKRKARRIAHGMCNVESPSGVLGSILADRWGTDAPLYVCRRTNNPASGQRSNRMTSGRFKRVILCYTSF